MDINTNLTPTFPSEYHSLNVLLEVVNTKMYKQEVPVTTGHSLVLH